MVFRKITFLLSFILLFIIKSPAQVWEIGGNAGASGYMGDLNQTNPIKISGIYGGAFVKANIDPYWSFGLHYNYGEIKADDANSKFQQEKDRNLNFYSSLHEVSFLVDFNFLEYFSGGGRKRLTPYLYAGVGGIIFNPKTKYQGTEYKLALYNTEGQSTSYKNYAVTVPYGAGVKYNIKNNWTIFSQIGYRNAYTDYLDDVSGNYPDPSMLNNNGAVRVIQQALADRSGEKTGVYLGNPNTQRGDFRKRDTYMFVGIGISYTFVSQKCYNF
jgi:opacity protein-like surface antigen